MIEIQESKKWYLSKGIIGGVGALLAFGLHMAGIDMTELDQAEIEKLVIDISGMASAALAIYGRLRAKKQLTK